MHSNYKTSLRLPISLWGVGITCSCQNHKKIKGLIPYTYWFHRNPDNHVSSTMVIHKLHAASTSSECKLNVNLKTYVKLLLLRNDNSCIPLVYWALCNHRWKLQQLGLWIEQMHIMVREKESKSLFKFS